MGPREARPGGSGPRRESGAGRWGPAKRDRGAGAPGVNNEAIDSVVYRSSLDGDGVLGAATSWRHLDGVRDAGRRVSGPDRADGHHPDRRTWDGARGDGIA